MSLRKSAFYSGHMIRDVGSDLQINADNGMTEIECGNERLPILHERHVSD
jgi:hypothetical protein